MATFRIWYIGSEDFSIEDATSEQEACEKLGWESHECRVQRIPDEIILAPTFAPASGSASNRLTRYSS